MRIGIDARMYNASGIGRYIRNLIKELEVLDRENSYFIFLRRSEFSSIYFKNSNFKKVLADFIWYGYKEQFQLPTLLKKYNLDLVHFPHFNIPIFYRGKYVVTIHDLTHLDFKMSRASAHNKAYYEIKHQTHKAVIYWALRRSKKIIAVSEYVKDQIVKKFRIEDKKIAVTYEAADEKLFSITNKVSNTTQQNILEKFHIKSPYLFYVGNAHPHKNIDGLLKAFDLLRKKYQYLQLVLSGKEDFFWDKIKKHLSDDIKYLGFVTDEELISLYRNAQAFVFPSLSEGFGIPLLEAFACGTPVVASNKTSLPEIGGEAAIYFDPYDIKDMVEKITEVLNNQKLRNELIKRGKDRVKEFSWEKMAEQTLKTYQEVM